VTVARFEVVGVTVHFGGNLALADVSLEADGGQVVGLIGPNGAGKTTLFNVITGLQASTEGRVLLDGKELDKLSPTKRARRGLARTFQRLELFTMLSVRENIAVAADVHRRWSKSRIDVDRQVDQIIQRVGLGAVADTRVTALPTGQGRLVELGRALACEPKVLLLDEPASGQDETETELFSLLLRELADEGVAVVLVEHDMKLVMDVCDSIHVLNYGQILAVGTPEEIRAHEAVREAYLGQGAGA
jgi:branched-chain amino acid transport system ATP-binding protein